MVRQDGHVSHGQDSTTTVIVRKTRSAKANYRKLAIGHSQAKAARDPAAPAKRSKPALVKAARHGLDVGTPAHSLSTLTAELATIVRNTCRAPNAKPDAPTFDVLTTPNAKQLRALELLARIRL